MTIRNRKPKPNEVAVLIPWAHNVAVPKPDPQRLDLIEQRLLEEAWRSQSAPAARKSRTAMPWWMAGLWVAAASAAAWWGAAAWWEEATNEPPVVLQVPAPAQNQQGPAPSGQPAGTPVHRNAAPGVTAPEAVPQRRDSPLIYGR